MHRFNIPGTIRGAFMFYNTFEEVDKLAEGIQKAKRLLRRN
jgi:cysteine desulfurase/selenocysteine lyase